MEQILDFGEFLPDQYAQGNPGSRDIKNVYPADKSYLPIESFMPTGGGSELPSKVLNGYLARDRNGVVFVYAGTQDYIYQVTAGVPNNISQGAYSTGDDDTWNFLQYQQELIATNFTANPQKVNLGGSLMSDLGGSPPKARYITNVKGQVILGNINDSVDGLVPNRVHWSDLDNPEIWDVTQNNLAGQQDLRGGGGFVQGVVGGEFGVVFQERAIWRMTPIGDDDIIFQFNEIERNRGALIPGSIIQYGRNIFYIGQDGFYALVDGSASQPIGSEKVDRWFFETADLEAKDLVKSLVDPNRKLVVWLYKTKDNVNDYANRMIIYNWSVNRWSYADVEMDMLFNSATFGFTLDDLDQFGDLDNLPASLDSRIWAGGEQSIFAGFDSQHRFGYFTGTPLDAVLETKEIGGDGRSFVNYIRPYVEGNSSTAFDVELGFRDSLTGEVNYMITTPSDTGRCYLRNDSRYHRSRVTISGGFTHGKGIGIDIMPSGDR